MSDVTETHDLKETLTIEVETPGHDPRVTTELFISSKKELLERDGARCWICGRTAEESGSPLEAHHSVIERSLANMIDWALVQRDCESGMWGVYAQVFDWSKFTPDKWELFVDDMRVNGRILCKGHHTSPDEGIHDLPFPLWIAQRYGLEGYKFSNVEIIHHEQT